MLPKGSESMGYDGSLKFDTSIATEGFNAGVTKLGSIAKSGMAVLSTAVLSGVAAFGALTKAALDSKASLEQNIGGIETLFGAQGAKSVEEYADLVGKSVKEVEKEYEQLMQAQTLALDNANKAYQTAGMSANEYMETVTSFAASLKQSVKNETEAAKAADQAIIDMADNANKMGTAMESIQNAYQGFAKQNYTMLDNLKLGYGGTKGEMERLLADAEKLSGVKYDISNLADVYEAIHVIQKELGITGTTAKEAATTISGSMASAKAAFDNFLTGSISVEDFADTIGIAAGNIARNLGEIVPRLAETVPAAARAIFRELNTVFQENGAESIFEAGGKIVTDFVTGLASEAPSVIGAGTELLNSLITNMGEQAPQLLESGLKIGESLISGILQVGESIFTVGSGLLENMISGLSASIPLMLEKASEIASTLMQKIQEYAPGLLETGVNLLAEFITGIASQIPSLIPQALQMIVVLADSIISNLPTIVSAGIELLKSLVMGIINGLPTLIAEGPRIINDFADAIYSAVGNLIKAGLEMIVNLVKGIWENRGLLLENAGEIFMAFINVFSLSNLFNLGKKLIQNLINGIKNLGPNVVKAGGNIVEFLVSGIKNLAMHPVETLKNIGTNALRSVKNLKWSELGKNMVNGIITGLKGMGKKLLSEAKGLLGSVLEEAKDFLGIHSPSTVFRDQIGKYMALGVGDGFVDNMPIEDIEKSFDDVIAKANQRVARTTTTVLPSVENIVNSTMLYKQANEAKPDTKREIIIHTHVELDGKEVGYIITPFVDTNMAEDEDLKGRGM